MKIRSKHPQYEKFCGRWQRCRDFKAGSDEVKAGDYLKALSGMSHEDFNVYQDRAQLFNALNRTIESLVGAVLSRPPRLSVPTEIENHLKDLTLGDEPFEVVAQWVLSEVLTVGRAGILLDMPEESGGRPYWVRLPAERIVNWKTAKVGYDPNRLVLVVIRADQPVENEDDPYEHKTAEGYMELRLNNGIYQSRRWAPSDSALVKSTQQTPLTPGDWITPERFEKPLDFIPFTFIGTGGVTPTVSKPPLIDLVDVLKGHYYNSADHEHGLLFTALPTPWHSGAKGEGPLKIGPSVSWDLGENGKAGMLEFGGQGLGAIREAMAVKKKEMAVLGARLLEDAPAVERDTATAVKLRYSGESATLRTISHAASVALGRMLRWHAWWQAGTGEMPTDVEVHLHDEFLAPRLTADELRANMESVQAGLLSEETFFHNAKQGGWTRPGITFEDEKHAIKPAPVGGRNKRKAGKR